MASGRVKQPASTSIRQLRTDLDLTIAELATLHDAAPNAVACWDERDACPRSEKVMSRLAMLAEVRHFGLVIYTVDGLRLLLRTGLPVLGGRTPLEAFTQGQPEDVLAVLAADYEGLGS